MLTALARFTRPHTIIATTIQVTALYIITGGRQLFLSTNLGPVLVTLFTCLALNIYVVGLNQISDIDIDRINKPSLPLASQEMTLRQGWVVVVLMGLAALAGGLIAGPYLLATVVLIIVIGTLYSIPPFRLKQFSVWAAISIAFARGVIANLGVALHYEHAFGRLETPSPQTLFAIGAYFFCFGLVIAIYKDIPDMLGDRMHGIQSFTVTLGPQRAFNLGRLILTVAYLGVMALTFVQLAAHNGTFFLVSQGIALVAFWIMSGRVRLLQPSSVTRFYMFLWGLFYAQYIILSLVQISGKVV